jgi:hypothetical protein
MTIFADVVLADPTNTLLATVALLCLLVVPLEAACFFAFQRRVAGFWLSTGLIVLANALSLCVGFVLAETLPEPDRNVPEIAIWLAAFLLSWLIEYAVIRLFRGRFNLTRLGLATGVANAASYLVLGLAAAWWS